jgi:hypothetical protein
MNVTVIAGNEVFVAALKSAREVRQGPSLSGLAAPLDAGLMADADTTWSLIEEALKTAYRHGRDQAVALFDAAWAKAEALIASAGRKGGQVYDLLLARAQKYLDDFIRGAIARLATQHAIGDGLYGLTSIRCTQKIVLTGSLKATLTDVFALTTSGEIEIVAEYGRRQA